MTKQGKTQVQQMSEAQKKAYINQELETRVPNKQRLSEAIARDQQAIKFNERQIELMKGFGPELFAKNQPEFPFETEPSFTEFMKDAKTESLELANEQLKAKNELDIKAYEVESATIRLLEKGELVYGLSEEEILKQ